MPPVLTVRPLFLLSQPRSGSTLVQRVIAAHPSVATTSEPWILLPLLYAVREEGARAEYWHTAAAQGIQDFCETLPGGRDDYLAELRDLATRLYERAAGAPVTYFVDKTPHYHLILDELMAAFEDARFVFLWRNPLAVLSSLLATFRDGRWEPWLFSLDLFDAISSLVSAMMRGDGRAYSVRYEDLLRGAEGWRGLFDFLELEFQPGLLESFGEVRLAGRYGDHAGTARYAELSAEPLEKWPETINSPLRRRWSRRYLHWIGERRLAAMGYELGELLAELRAAPSNPARMPADALSLASSRITDARRRRRLRAPDSPRPVGGAWGGRRRARRATRSRARRLGGRTS
jgi:hypothetical protein